MAQFMSNALAGFSKNNEDEEHDDSPHYRFIKDTLLPNTVKIQKELRGRKFKDIQAKLGEALVHMHKFQFETWPPDPLLEKPSDATPHKSLDDHLQEQQQQQQQDLQQTGSDDDDIESTIGDFKKASEDDDLRPFDDVSTTTQTTAKTSSTNGSHSVVEATNTTQQQQQQQQQKEVEDDPLTREPMHESITNALEAYTLIFTHPQKTNKACELALFCTTQLVKRGYVSGRAGGQDDRSGSGPLYRETPLDQRPEPSLLHQLMAAIQKCGESAKDSVQAHVIAAFQAIMTCPKCSAHEASMLLVIRSIFHIYLVSKNTSCQQKSKKCLMEICSSIVRKMEDSPLKQNSLFYTDSYYLMRSLVKLSSKALQGIDDKDTTASNFLTRQIFTTNTVDPLALNNKVLSLELICQIMECAGDSICYGEKFVQMVQAQLCVALLKNCMSNHTQVAFISQKTFLVLVYKFKTHLKDEISVFMTNIFLRVLQSDNSSFAQKALVLESLRSLCNDPVLLTQIFLNYDCDFDAMNLYKDILFHLTKLSGKCTEKIPPSMNKKDAEELFELSLAAVEVLVSVLHTFLKALDMPAENHSKINDTAGKKIRAILGLKDVGQFKLQQQTQQQQEETQHQHSLDDADDGSEQQGLTARSRSSSASSFGDSASQLVADQIVGAFDRKRNLEQNFQMGSIKFTLSLKSGLKYFIDNDFVELDAQKIALFFLENKDKLDKTQMGEVLGKEPDSAFIKTPDLDPEKGGVGFFLRVLQHYTNALVFTDMEFDDAIRLFLSGFRLPGEAQKIDRIMEKFAERYTIQNPEVFHNADTAFILAFSVIMLNTDLHNPSIKPERRMTLDGFQRNNRGIGENGSDLPADFLTGIFKRIQKSPFSLKEDDAAREKAAADVMETSFFAETNFFGASSEDRKKKKFKQEREEMMSATEQLIRRRRGKATTAEKSNVDSVAPADVVKPMMDVTWGPIIGMLSQVLEFSTDERTIAVCLNGFVYVVRVASHSNMSLARDTFVNSLAKFTLLGSIKEMKYKNIEAIRTLMTMAVADGEYLGESWGPVLQCISQLARMRMSASGLDSDESFLKQESKAPAPKKQSNIFFKNQKEVKALQSKEMAEMNERAILETFSEHLIDNVFSSTVKLSALSLGHFIEQLVAVSKTELEGDTKRTITGVQKTGDGSSPDDDGPSIFLLQRLVEVADFNMDSRPRVIWTQVWEIMADFFAEIGCHRNQMVSVFAIDSLKQMSSKFLEKPELSETKFQRTFLKPFLLIIQNPETPDSNRELVLQCIDQMVSTKAHNLQSGWKVFFDIVMVASRDSNERIMVLSINILQRLLDDHLSQLCRLPASKTDGEEKDGKGTLSSSEARNRNATAEDFGRMCRASLAFVQQDGPQMRYPIGISMRALCHSAIYADLIAEKSILPPVSGAQVDDPNAYGYTYDGLDEKEALEMVLWRPILDGLASAAKSTATSRAGGVECLLQRGSVLAIRAILLRHGSLFSINQLSAILKETIIPAFKEAAEIDLSPVVSITSESPAMSNLDFMSEPMPLPPSNDDEGLLKFEEVARSMDAAPKRPLGPSELLLEACFTDMRHGGDGDLSQVYKFATKEMRGNSDGEQPFPDSWIATTAVVALGTLTDVASEVIVPKGREGASNLWPLVGDMIQTWCNGTDSWQPCEALVRVACKETNRFANRVSAKLEGLDANDKAAWGTAIIQFFQETLRRCLDIEVELQEEIIQEKAKVFKRVADNDQDIAAAKSFESSTWASLVPSLKIRCIAAHFLQEALQSLNESVPVPLPVAKDLLDELNRSRDLAEAAAKNEDIALAFQEAILSEWGMDDEDREEALMNVARLSQTQGSAMFFMMQTAGATNVMIQVLSALYEGEASGSSDSFAIPYLLEIMRDVFHKFAESEAAEGHRISNIKVAVYCTTFSSTIVCLLKAMIAFDKDHFEKQKAAFFPMVCRLITVQSEEIRELVQEILMTKFGPMLGVVSDGMEA
ncbi:MAG: hypothetical protein SGBAC_006689 [Bacillariaceae sp.]